MKPMQKQETTEPKRRGPKPLPPDKLKHRQVLYLTNEEYTKIREFLAQMRRKDTGQ